ncbi:hippocalcin-like protein 1 [Mya arenaria]|uniref:hippocalcin-like protein 1 n=1 Tax=Mya arenaria TaxID=6604 RepID=UPI0022E29C9E|nr:hippocalcin-like protein 1 [Mya arenaria]
MGAKTSKSESKLDQKSIEKLQHLIKGELSEEEIQSCFKTYQESRQTHKSDLTRDEFKKVYRGIFRCDSSEFAEHIFRTFDQNNDGHVNFQEFLLGLCLAGSKDIETKITWAFKVYDIDGDGTISWSEMRNIIKSVCNMASESLVDQIDRELTASHRDHQPPLFDRAADGSHETRDKSAEIADKIFLELDQNRDGYVTLEEFRDGALKMPLVVNLLECATDG